MRIIDSHYHWYPRAHFEKLAARADYPRAVRDGEGYRYYFNNGRSYVPLPAVWFDLDAGLAVSDATGHDVTVVATTGVLAGLLDQLPLAAAAEIAADYNEQLAQAQRAYPGRFFGTAAVPLGDTKEAVALLEHAVTELGLIGVNLPPVTAGGETIDSPGSSRSTTASRSSASRSSSTRPTSSSTTSWPGTRPACSARSGGSSTRA